MDSRLVHLISTGKLKVRTIAVQGVLGDGIPELTKETLPGFLASDGVGPQVGLYPIKRDLALVLQKKPYVKGKPALDVAYFVGSSPSTTPGETNLTTVNLPNEYYSREKKRLSDAGLDLDAVVLDF